MKRIYYAPVFFFILFVIFLITFELYQGRTNYEMIMKSKAREIVKTVIAFRKWGASVENLYAKSDKVPPNPYLSWRTDRDITAGDVHLTMVNPSYMTRLVSQVFNEENRINIKLIGIKPSNPFNSANEWQERAFESFKSGVTEYNEASRDPLKNIIYRYMSPLYIAKPCLSCHAKAGFRDGDLIGGLSVVFESSPIAGILFRDTVRNVSVYILISIILLATALILQKKIYMLNQKQEETIHELNSEIFRREKGEKALVRQTRMASQGELLTLVAHHWRQPLNAISLTLDVLRYHLQESKIEDPAPFLDIDQSQQLIQDLSASIDMFRGRYTNGNQEKPFSATESLISTVQLMEPVLTAYNIKIWISCQSCDDTNSICICTTDKRKYQQCPLDSFKILGSSGEFSQAIVALIKNAYESILEQRQSGKEFRSGIIAVSANITNDEIQICITDNGMGIPQENADHIFDPYFTTKGYDYGRGTGLYFAKTLIQKFKGGKIAFTSDKEKTEFTISMNLYTED